ncbi:MAG TPA: CHAP domain-containing protein [Anaeromyxobacteraceae bacterium]|nr:CHAP domain-containing protein [Anaeromyxobacteraceae bacterium]
MRPHRTLLAALGLLSAACAAPGVHARRSEPLPPPARERRAGAGDPGAGPASGSSAHAVQARRAPREVAVRRAVETAEVLIGKRDIVMGGVHYGDDCAALVRAAFSQAGTPLPAGADARALHRLAASRGALRRRTPSPGDLVFIADRPGGVPEHVGLVESVGADGTALVLHRTGRGVLRLRANVTQPWKVRSDAGKALNDVLVVGAGRITAGRLVVAFATML